MEFSLGVSVLAGVISFILSTVTITRIYKDSSSDDNLGWLGFSMLASGFSIAFGAGVFIHYLMYIYPIINGR